MILSLLSFAASYYGYVVPIKNKQQGANTRLVNYQNSPLMVPLKLINTTVPQLEHFRLENKIDGSSDCRVEYSESSLTNPTREYTSLACNLKGAWAHNLLLSIIAIVANRLMIQLDLHYN